MSLATPIPLSHRERKGPIGAADGTVRGYAPTARTPHPPTRPGRAGPSFCLWEKGA